jgi:DNA-binding GntR family transcriptional regulator
LAETDELKPGTDGSPRASLTDEAYRAIKSEIMENRMPPGFLTLETDLAAQFGISRTPIREAVIRLCEEGLVEVKRRRGVRVLPISVEDMREIYDLLTLLEADCARRLTEAGLPSSQIQMLENAVSEMESALSRDSLDEWAWADDRFHRLHLEFLTNRRLARMIGQLLDQAHRVRMFTLQLRKKPMKSTKDHRIMVRALQKGNPEESACLYTVHRQQAAVELFEILERYNLPYL